MKLLLCRECGDLSNLTTERVKSCSCGAASGRYLSDGLNAEITDGTPIGFTNASFDGALASQPDRG